MRQPRVLVVSNNCFSTTGSNGRTLAQLFDGWPHEALAQFFISSEIPDSPVCCHYYRVTDSQALKSAVLRKVPTGTVVSAQPLVEASSLECERRTRIGKTAFTSIARDAVWRTGAWARVGFWSWVDAFSPEIVLLQAGDAPFMYRIAVEISTRRRVPLMIFNSEDYYFKDYDYMTPQGHVLSRFMYSAFRRRLVAATNEAMGSAAHIVHVTDALRRDFERIFDAPSSTVMTATTMKSGYPSEDSSGGRVSYLGNLGLGRHASLIEIAAELQAIDSSLHIDVYGRSPSQGVADALKRANGIRYRGFVSYEETCEVMRRSDILIHVESFLPFHRMNVRHGFSTKIPDSLASGTCLLVYAPPELALVEYLRREGAACVVTCPEGLHDTLPDLVFDANLRKEYVCRALDTVERNHSRDATTARFQGLLSDVAASNCVHRHGGNCDGGSKWKR